ncbi:MAG: hypothetical protein HS108_08345 [Planctomycetes bacterium]|jgi:hypothetical protein|nr:hypothetical protein [Planctomycetota bacterium]MCL4730811.1 hypothetical protein [Planctomycetota bacterium]
MSNELAPDGPELQPDLMGDFGNEEAASEEASHLLPAIRELPQDKEFVPAAFFSMRLADGSPGNPPRTLGELLGASLFQSLADVHLFGRAADSEPWLEVEAVSPEPVQLIVAQELFGVSGQPMAEDDLGMFEMVAGRIAKLLKRDKQPMTENAAGAAARSAKLAALKGRFADRCALVVAGSFDAAKVIDCCLCLGMKRRGDQFGWFGSVGDEPTFVVRGEPTALAAGARGAVARVHFSFEPVKVAQPAKTLERMFTACNYFVRRLGGKITRPDGSAPPDSVARGEDPALAAAVKKITDAGLRPGNVVARRLA